MARLLILAGADIGKKNNVRSAFYLFRASEKYLSHSTLLLALHSTVLLAHFHANAF